MITSRAEIFHAGTREEGQRGLMDRARPGILNFLAKCPDCDACLANEFVTVDSRISSPNRSSNNAPASLITVQKKRKKNASIHVRQSISSAFLAKHPPFSSLRSSSIPQKLITIRFCVERDYRHEERYRSTTSRTDLERVIYR